MCPRMHLYVEPFLLHLHMAAVQAYVVPVKHLFYA